MLKKLFKLFKIVYKYTIFKSKNYKIKASINMNSQINKKKALNSCIFHFARNK